MILETEIIRDNIRGCDQIIHLAALIGIHSYYSPNHMLIQMSRYFKHSSSSSRSKC